LDSPIITHNSLKGNVLLYFFLKITFKEADNISTHQSRSNFSKETKNENNLGGKQMLDKINKSDSVKWTVFIAAVAAAFYLVCTLVR